MRFFLYTAIMLASAAAHAGFVELGLSANYRASGYDADNYINSVSYTGSFSYYFWEMCAWELNYTRGYSVQATKASGANEPKSKIEDSIEMTSLDLVLSLAERQDPFRPYVKTGVGYLTKDRYRKIDDDPRELIQSQDGIVPSGGLGFALSLTKEFSIKLGVDAWTSPLDEKPLVVDYAGRVGVSFMF